jgi:hypothetical protein
MIDQIQSIFILLSKSVFMLKIGVFGAGHLGKIHIQLLLELDNLYNLVGFFDPDDHNASVIIEKFGLTRFHNPEELIQSVDCIDVVTPTLNHFEIAQIAIKRGKHVFIEKPITETIEDLSGEKIYKSTFDGCGAPLHAVSLIALAKIAQNAVLSDTSKEQRKVVDAARKFPIYNSGNKRDVAQFMQTVPGFFTKEGAEGVHVGALSDGRSFAVKFEDGSMRPRAAFVVAVLRFWGIEENVLEKLSHLEKTPILGGGKPVGSMQALPIGR